MARHSPTGRVLWWALAALLALAGLPAQATRPGFAAPRPATASAGPLISLPVSANALGLYRWDNPSDRPLRLLTLPVTQSRLASVQAAWSPDGERLAALVRDDVRGDSALVVAASNGAAAQTALSGALGGMVWAPDGQHLVVARDQQLWWLTLADTALGESRQLAAPPVARPLGWSADGQTLYLATFQAPGASPLEALTAYNLAGGQSQTLLASQFDGAGRGTIIRELTLSPGVDGPWLAYALSDTRGNAPTAQHWLVRQRLDGSQARRWALGNLAPGGLAVAPDGHALAFRGERLTDPAARWWWADATSRQAHPLALSGDPPPFPAAIWASDGGFLALEAPEGVAAVASDGALLGGWSPSAAATSGGFAPAVTPAAGRDAAVPYVNQMYDARDDFCGIWACGPTAAVMALAYFGKLAAWPTRAAWPTAHDSQYGNYLSLSYTARGTTFDRVQPQPASGCDHDHNTDARGAYGWTTDGGDAWASRLADYAQKHDLGTRLGTQASLSQVKADLDAGRLVILSTKLTSAGHLVVARGYTTDNTLIVNDPYGDKHQGYPNTGGAGAHYAWSEMQPVWYLTLTGPVPTPAPPSSPAPPGTGAPEITQVKFSPTVLSTGSLLRVDITVVNRGSTTLLSQGPPPGTVYEEGESFSNRGFDKQDSRFRVGIELNDATAASALRYPYRWGLGKDLPPGASTTVTGYVRLARTGQYTYQAALIEEWVRVWSQNLGPTAVQVFTVNARAYLPTVRTPDGA